MKPASRENGRCSGYPAELRWQNDHVWTQPRQGVVYPPRPLRCDNQWSIHRYLEDARRRLSIVLREKRVGPAIRLKFQDMLGVMGMMRLDRV